MNILITGSSGFLGQHIVNEFKESPKYKIISAVRCSSSLSSGKTIVVGDINKKTAWDNALIGQDVIIHCAGRAHEMNDDAKAMSKYREVNTYGTLNLAKQAAAAGIKRFIFISTIKVNGESTAPGRPFRRDDKNVPKDPYALSKYEAEQGLIKIASKTSMEVVIIRPPLIYGPGVKANFAALLNLVSKGIPLPFAFFKTNKRSLVSVYNLIDLIDCCINNPKAANEIFLVSDDEDISTNKMIHLMSQALNKKIILLPVPISFLMLSFQFLGKKKIISRLVESLELDISHTKKILNWKPQISVREGFRRCI